MGATDVHIVGHTGEALVIERQQNTVEYFQRRDMAEWPDDECAQRAWCLDRTLASRALHITKPDENAPDWVDENVAYAERFRAYINGST